MAVWKVGEKVASCWGYMGYGNDELGGADLGLPMLPRFEPRASCVLGMGPTTKLYSLSSLFTFHFEAGSY